MRVVFMGTPDYSVRTLEALLAAGHTVVGVFAQPDKPVGRKHLLTPPPVKVFAEANGIPVFQPASLRDGTALAALQALAPDVIVVVAYGKILPPEILQLPKFGCVNGHASLLPEYRGASPIQWCIVNGATETGVSTMFMDAGMDTGDILETVRVPIGGEETADQLIERLSVVSAELMKTTLDKLENGTAVRKKQPETGVSYAPILKKEMAELDFRKPAAVLHNAVRGFYSWPCAFFFLDGKRIKVTESRVGEKSARKPGTVLSDENTLSVVCGDGVTLRLLTVQPEGSKPMGADQMLRGHKIPDGTCLIKE